MLMAVCAGIVAELPRPLAPCFPSQPAKHNKDRDDDDDDGLSLQKSYTQNFSNSFFMMQYFMK